MDRFNNVYNKKTVLVTGHTGFKGSWLSIWLNELGAKVVGYGLDPYTDKDNFVLSGLSSKIIDIRGDIRDRDKLRKVFDKYKPDIVFHLAAQPLVRLSYEQPYDTYEVNVMGTINVLECIRKSPETKVGILVTSDKCYENNEQIWGYKESDPLGGYDPYSSSKGACEIAISSWRRSFFNREDYSKHKKAIASVRAGNVIGGGDWAKDRLVPDCIRAIEENRSIEIRSPKSIRPWQHVLDPLYGYLFLGQKLLQESVKYAESWNFGPNPDSIIAVWEIAERIVGLYGAGKVLDTSNPRDLHESKLLMLDISKARFKMNWEPRMSIYKALELTVEWYKRYKTEDVYNICVEQIEEFCS